MGDGDGDRINGAGLPSRGGRYVLSLCLRHPAAVAVRSEASFDLPAGGYAYVGSAMGPGGLAARIGRYCRLQRRCHWHVDFLLQRARPLRALCFGPTVAECRLAEALAAVPGTTAVPGFGCTDCRCPSHLYRLPAERGGSLLQALASAAPELPDHLLADVDLRPLTCPPRDAEEAPASG